MEKKSGSGIVIPDPQHCTAVIHTINHVKLGTNVPGIEELIIVFVFYLTASSEKLRHLVQRAQESARVQEPHPLLNHWVLDTYNAALRYWSILYGTGIGTYWYIPIPPYRFLLPVLRIRFRSNLESF
jgi:hypothetical protein